MFAAVIAADAKSLNVAASFKPVHSLVASVMQGVGEPYLIVKGAASAHAYAMSPQDAEALQGADVVFWIGPGMEAFLASPLGGLGAKAEAVALTDTAGLARLAPREGGAFEAHEDEGHARGEETDPHIWLDPENAILMVQRIEETLSAADPGNAAIYKENAARTVTALQRLEAEIAAELQPVKDQRFITFHDAFQYFEKRFGLSAAGSVSVHPDDPVSAARIAALQAKMREAKAACVFAEPNFPSAIVSVVMEGTDAKRAEIDPEASALPEGPDLYFQSLRGIAQAMKQCLSP